GEISPATQTKLLRVLDTSTFRHVGGTAEIHVDVRVLAATNRNLPAMIRNGQFREDLYYRMSTIPMELPPLRKRGSDIELIANYFVGIMNERFQSSRRIGADAMTILRRHTWPGNVRELLRAVEGAMVVCDGPEILPQHLPQSVRTGGMDSPFAHASNGTSADFPTLEALEKEPHPARPADQRRPPGQRRPAARYERTQSLSPDEGPRLGGGRSRKRPSLTPPRLPRTGRGAPE
ncbi:MAG: sigma 54-interacting transcriptional regulator, partial [Acidobacteriota bacterium]|nr:sigma 54-interacting transcriptional regulator [Acidobacteriota bacterium]